jgi:hypothetical protein
MKKTLFSLLLATVAVFTSNAAVVPISDVDSVYFDDVTLQAGTSKVIGAMLINKQEFAAFQLKILTPEQVNIVPYSIDTEFGDTTWINPVGRSIARPAAQATYSFNCIHKDTISHELRILAWQATNKPVFSAVTNPAAIFEIKINVPASTPAGKYILKVTGLEATGPGANPKYSVGTVDQSNDKYMPTTTFVVNVVEPAEETTLANLLANGVEGKTYKVTDNLAVVAQSQKTSQLFASDGNNNWIKVNVGDNYDAVKGYAGINVTGVYTTANGNATLTASQAPTQAQAQTVTPATYNLAEHFAPVADEVAYISGFYFDKLGASYSNTYTANDPVLGAYSDNNSVGQYVQFKKADWNDLTFAGANGQRVKVLVVNELKSAWSAISKIAATDPGAHTNVIAYALDAAQVTTGVDDVNAVKAVKSVSYYNVAGMESATPFEGMNLVVTRYTDGTTSTSKVMK